jgi:fumarate reductase flavoprotein subunit
MTGATTTKMNWFPLVIIGAGGTGLTAGLAAADAGIDVQILERDRRPRGSTAMSTGLIPAAGTIEQAQAGIEDSPEQFVADIMAKTKHRTDAAIARRLAEESADTISWLRDRHGIPLALVQGFRYPGHSAMRMYGTPGRSGAELMDALYAAAERAGITILPDATVTELICDSDRVTGLRFTRPDGGQETVNCGAVILACSGFGGAAAEVARLIPQMADALYHGHPGNSGDALRWGIALGAATADLDSYQGHGGLAAGYGIPILWPLIMEGGFQVNAAGARFSDETAGYSEQAARVNAQPGRIAWSIFDERLHELMLQFEDYREAIRAGAIIQAATVTDLAQACKLPAAALAQTMTDVARMAAGQAADPFGREFHIKPALQPPYRAAKVTGALFHTQGGLVVDENARVLKKAGDALPNLFAGGGAARGISGPGADGYLAGNGLLTATALGKLAGRQAAKDITILSTGPP